ncbi:MAG: hypothetical protein WEB58_14720 [Planctomycetaceae bacterium]|jgi:hypothetical protein
MSGTWFTRFVCLTTMMAILACPVWCGAGFCHSGRSPCADANQMPQRDQGNLAVNGAADHAPTCCCGCNRSARPAELALPQAAEGDPQPVPYDDDPCQESCQGICGGAVVERADEFPLSYDAGFISLADSALHIAAGPANGFREADDARQKRCLLSGREIRTLHMSFLC